MSILDSPLPLTFLHEVEIVNALHRGVFVGRRTPAEAHSAVELFRSDFDRSLFRRTALDHVDLTRRALEISQAWVEKLGVRSLDVLHVAAAQLIEADAFATTDARQRALAEALGLRIEPL